MNFPPFADFLIATEAELNKVSWTTRPRLIQDTIVVLVTTFLLALFLFLMDQTWRVVLSWKPIGVLQISEDQSDKNKSRRELEMVEPRSCSARGIRPPMQEFVAMPDDLLTHDAVSHAPEAAETRAADAAAPHDVAPPEPHEQPAPEAAHEETPPAPVEGEAPRPTAVAGCKPLSPRNRPPRHGTRRRAPEPRTDGPGRPR